MKRWIEPVVLSGRHVTLQPMEHRHIGELGAAAADGELWRLWYTSIPAPGGMREYIERALGGDERGELPFVVRENVRGEIIGTTRYCNVVEQHQRLEIGYTWYAQRAQRTAVNTECKLLLLQHAFETLNAIAVEFRTHWMNLASRAAIARLGAKQDGVLRNHQRMADGSLRDTVVFSIIESEWPAVKRNLTFRLERPSEGGR